MPDNKYASTRNKTYKMLANCDTVPLSRNWWIYFYNKWWRINLESSLGFYIWLKIILFPENINQSKIRGNKCFSEVHGLIPYKVTQLGCGFKIWFLIKLPSTTAISDNRVPYFYQIPTIRQFFSRLHPLNLLYL